MVGGQPKPPNNLKENEYEKKYFYV
jgi:hypothetical protein